MVACWGGLRHAAWGQWLLWHLAIVNPMLRRGRWLWRATSLLDERQQSGGFMALRVEGDVCARNVQFDNSDASLKTNIAPLDISAAARLFDGIIPKQFHWKPVKVKTKLGGEMPGVDDDPTSINLWLYRQRYREGRAAAGVEG